MTQTMTNNQENTAATVNIFTPEHATENHSTSDNKYYLIVADGLQELRIKADSARKNGVKAECLPVGWVYLNRNDAEDVAQRWTEGKRTIRVVPWHDERLDAIWYGTKSEKSIARKSIKLEFDTHQLNKKKEQIELDCHAKGLHPSWLYSNTIPDDLSDKDKMNYVYFKPLWDKTFEEKEKIDLRKSDISKEIEDSEESIDNEVGKEIFISGIPKKITDMNSLDQRFAQLEVSGRPCVYINRIDAQPISFNDFSRRLSGEVVRVDSDGQSKYIPASKFWEGNARKCIYRKIVFTNSKVDNETYNLFTGFGLKPKKGKCERIIDHIKDRAFPLKRFDRASKHFDQHSF
jgi:hypothetical protein